MTANAYQRNVLFLVRLMAMALLATGSVVFSGQTLAPGVGRFNRSTKSAKEQAAPAGAVTAVNTATQSLQVSAPKPAGGGNSMTKTQPGESPTFEMTLPPDFYVANAGASDTETLLITNLSKDSYTLDTFVSNEADFSVPPKLSAVVPAGGSYQVPITYMTKTPNEAAATLTFSAKKDGDGSAVTTSVNLRATAQPLSFMPPGTFGALTGKTSLTQNVTLINHTGEDYQISGLELKVIKNSGFLVTGIPASTPVKGKSSLQIPVAYRPHGKEASSEMTLLVHASKTGDASGAQQVFSVALKGVRGVGLVKQIEPFTLASNQTSSFQIIKIQSSEGDYDFSGAELSGPNAGDFGISDCNDSGFIHITKSKACSVTVTYQPVAASANQKTASGGGKATLQLTVKDKALEEITFAMDLTENGAAKSICDEPQTGVRHQLLPLIGPGATSDTVNCWYNSTSFYSLLSQVHYLYNPGGSANTVGADLATLHFLGGVQLSLAGSGSTNSCDSTTTGTNSSCNGGSAPGTAVLRPLATAANSATASTATPSLQQDVQSLIKGGDFAIRASWPVYQLQSHGVQILSMLQPAAGFTINGLSTQNTATSATEINNNISSETYVQVDAIAPADGGDSPGSIFFDYRVGGEFVGNDFAKAAGLVSSRFLLQTFAVGAVFKGSVRLSAQRYVGPEQFFVDSANNKVSVNNWKSWQLQVQITPTNIAK